MGRTTKITRIGILEISHIKVGEIHWCQTPHDREMRKSATHVVYMMSRPAGYLCKTCTAEWKKLWESVIEYED